ncbi:MAG TPA: hypothetical protein VFF57_01090, partial [Hanamia sp.]|nr:hypothetical protein [Hanamia sp.]
FGLKFVLLFIIYNTNQIYTIQWTKPAVDFIRSKDVFFSGINDYYIQWFSPLAAFNPRRK